MKKMGAHTLVSNPGIRQREIVGSTGSKSTVSTTILVAPFIDLTEFEIN